MPASRSGDRREARAGAGKTAPPRGSRRRDERAPSHGGRTGDRAERRPDDPPLPDDVDLGRLDRSVRDELSALATPNAERVGRHLVLAGDLLTEDPAAALAHARSARRTAARLPVVREAVGLAAYAAGEWQEALTELRAAQRMTGEVGYLPLLADCERGLGRPERALRLAGGADARRLDPASAVELRIVVAGARRDLGELDAALVHLADTPLERRRPRPWSARLWYAYADLLAAAGRTAEARDWFAAVLEVDEEGATDAEQRWADIAPD